MTEFQKYAKYSRFQVVGLPEYVTVAILKRQPQDEILQRSKKFLRNLSMFSKQVLWCIFENQIHKPKCEDLLITTSA